jgi:AcrR family transcriptional regulator
MVRKRGNAKTARATLARAAVLEDFRVRAIRQAVLDVVGREGLDAASMQRVADRAGIAKGTIYLYFKDREELLLRTARYVLDEVRAHTGPWLASEAPFPERLRGLIAAGFAILEQHRGFLRFYVPEPPTAAGGAHAARPRWSTGQKDAFHGDLVAFLERAMRRGEVRRSDPARLAHHVIDSANGLIVRRLGEAHPPAVEAEVDWIVDMLLHGMSPRGRSKS